MADTRILWRKMAGIWDFMTQHGGLAAILRHKIIDILHIMEGSVGGGAPFTGPCPSIIKE